MNRLFLYSTENLNRAFECYNGDTFIAHRYKAVMEEQINKGMDIFASQGDKGTMALFRLTALVYAKRQYEAHIFHLAQVAMIICWFDQEYTKERLKDPEALLQTTCRKIETLHDTLDTWKNPALCSRAIRQIEQEYRTIDLKELSLRLGANRAYLSRVLSQSMKVSFLDMLHTKRILVAMDAFDLTEQSLNLERLAADLGYSSAHYFYCVFKKYVGLTPTECWHLMRV